MKKLSLVMALIMLLSCVSSFCVSADKCEHKYGEWYTKTEATSTEKGVIARKCSKCFEEETKYTSLTANYFTDVPVGKWYETGVKFCSKYGYMSGTSNNPPKFSPDLVLTRAQFVVILYAIDGADYICTKSSFDDIVLGKWYANAVEWAYRNGYTSGVGSGIFGYANSITRESLAQFLYTYSVKNGYDVSKKGDISEFADGGKVAKWAKEAMSWAYGNGLISGTGNNNISPKGEATRGTTAVMIRKYFDFHGHIYDDGNVVTKRNCSQSGSTKFTCLNCGYEKTVNYPAGHVFDTGGTVKYPATCTQDGTMLRHCSMCGNNINEVIPKLGHNYVEYQTIEATCTQPKTIVYKCTRCSDKKTETYSTVPHKFIHGHCRYCDAIEGYNVLLSGKWYGLYMWDSEYEGYLKDGAVYITFDASNMTFVDVEGDYTFYGEWKYSYRDGDDIWYVLKDDGDYDYNYYMAFDNNTSNSTYLTLWVDFDDYQILYVSEDYYWAPILQN